MDQLAANQVTYVTRRLSKRNAEAQARELLRLVAIKFNTDTKSLIQQHRDRLFVDARKAFCTIGRFNLGLSTLTLAYVLQRDHTTILYLSSPEMQARKKAQIKRRKQKWPQ